MSLPIFNKIEGEKKQLDAKVELFDTVTNIIDGEEKGFFMVVTPGETARQSRILGGAHEVTKEDVIAFMLVMMRTYEIEPQDWLKYFKQIGF